MRRKIIYDPKRDYYTILGIQFDASVEDLRVAYRHAVRAVHPDLHPDEADWATEQLQLINEAYDVLRQHNLRREYDRQRWAHAPNQPYTPRYSSSTPVTGYDPDRPWWQRVSGSGLGRPPTSPRVQVNERSGVLKVSDWLQTHGLGRLDPIWLTLVGLWRSPYSGLLSVLSVMLAVNVAVIIYVFIDPPAGHRFLDNLGQWIGSDDATDQPSFGNTPTPDELHRVCPDPSAQILTPVNYDLVGDVFSVYGTVKNPDMWNYVVEIGYLGEVVTPDTVPSTWEIVRWPPLSQTVPEPSIEENLLVEGVDLTGKLRGYYAVRVRVVLRSGTVLTPCDVIVRY